MGKIIKNIFIYSLILAVAIFSARLYKIKSNEILNTANFTDYFQLGDSVNGGLEIVAENFTTFKKEYDFSEKIIETVEIKKVEKIKYTVVKGDNFKKISTKFGVSADTIKVNNKSARTGKLTVGDKLEFPSEDGYYYKIKKNDTIGKIAKTYGLKATDILNSNNVDPKKLRAGDTLFLKGVSLKKVLQVEGGETQAKTSKTSKGKGSGSGATQGKIDEPVVSTGGGGGFAFPVKYAGVASSFGNRFHPVLKKYIFHTGVDLVAKYVPLRASRDGIVSFAGYMNGYGKIIIIKHNGGYETRYAHLSVISTKVGQQVKKGELIGKTGASGRVTGPHLHFEIRKDGKALNPMKYLN